MRVFKKILLLQCVLIFVSAAFSQSSEQKVSEAVHKINGMIEEVHQLASQRKIDAAFKKLNEINRTFSTENTWGTFIEEYRNAKMENPSFDFQIRSDLPAKLDPGFWKDYQSRCDKMMANQDQALEGFKSSLELNKWDKLMAYGAQIKNSYETIKNATENLGSGNIPKFAYDLYGNMNDFIKNYTKIQDAEIAGIDIQTQRMEFQNMMKKAELNKELYRDFESTINVNIDMIHTFNSNIQYVKDRKADAATGPLKPLSPTLDYVWNYEFYENQIKEACDAMEHYEIKCSKLKADIDGFKSDARKDWSRVKGNIYASDDEAQKPNYLADCDEAWNDFYKRADELYQQAYQLYCLDNSAGSSSSENSNNPFDGAAAGGTTAKVVDQEHSDSGTSSDDESKSFKFENIKITAQVMYEAYGGEKLFLDVSYDVVFPGRESYNVSYLQNAELDGKKLSQNSRYLSKIGYGDRLSLNYSVTIPNDLEEANHQIKIILDLGQEWGTKDFTTNFSMSGNSVQQGSTSNNSSSESSRTSNREPKEDSNNSGGNNTVDPNHSSFIGTIYADGGSGAYAALEIKYFKDNDRIVFVKKSGTLKHVQLIWRKQGGIWETAYQGTKTDFRYGDIKKNMPGSTTHLNFVVNANHNRWSASDVPCKMDVYLVGKSSASEDESSTAGAGGDPNASNTSEAKQNKGITYIGKAFKSGNTGEYIAINVADLEVNDKIRIEPISGELTDYYIHWLSKEGKWKTAGAAGNLDVHNKPYYDFRLDTKYKNMPPSTTHIIVYVNNWRGSWNPVYRDAEAKIYIVHGGGGPLVDPSTVNPRAKPNIPGEKTKQDNNSNAGTQTKPKKETPSNTVNNEFNELIKKANESFNKPYWEESQGTRASSNPKQESLDYLVKASRLINREADVETKFSMVQQLVSTSTRFAQRVYAYESKVPFINLAGQTVSRAANQVSSIKETASKSKTELQKYAYGKIADSWRAVRDATLVQGGTNYSKESCDQQYVKYKKLSER